MQDFTQYNPGAQAEVQGRALSTEAAFFQKVYMWMCGGLALTGFIAFFLSNSAAWQNMIYATPGIFYGALIAELVVVMALSFMINKIQPMTAAAMFLVYAALNGATFSVIFMGLMAQGSGDAIYKAFFCTAGIYFAMAAYGLLTKRSLQGLGSFLFMGVVGLILASIVNLFFKSNQMDFIICLVGVLIFSALTAYDHQKLRVIHYGGFEDGAAAGRTVIYGALTLYLDFINLFLYLLRLFARRD